MSAPDAAVDAAAAALGLTLSEESRAGVAANVAILARIAAELEAVELGPEDEPLPVFRP